jgi:hypothetical protein
LRPFSIIRREIVLISRPSFSQFSPTHHR